MDRDVPPRVTYWTGIWRPEMEAISSEVAQVRESLSPASLVVSFSRGQKSAWLWGERTLRVSARRWRTLRTVAGAIERSGDITHAWGPIDDWYFMRILGRRPFVFSVVLPGQAKTASEYTHVSLFVTETEPLAAELRRAGVASDRVRVVYPGVDLSRFSVRPPPGGRFRLLFASSPSDVQEFPDRGIPMLVEVARACPEVDVVLLWRQWGDSDAARQALAALDLPPNVLIEALGERTMPEVFASAHAVVSFYRPGFGKSCPNSLIEGLACGRPVLVSEHCGIAGLIANSRAGRIAPPSREAIVDELRALQDDYAALSVQARRLAERAFDREMFIAGYRAAYADVIRPASPQRSRVEAMV